MAILNRPPQLPTASRLPVQQATQRSQYLRDALEALNQESQDIRSPGELAARLGASYLLNRGRKKADAALGDALKAEAEARKGRILAPFEAKPASLTGQGVTSESAKDPLTAAMLKGAPIPAPAQAQGNGSLISALMSNLIKRESGGRAGILGPQTKYGRAEGLTQMLPATAQSMAKKLGIPWEPQRMRGTSPEDADYQRMLGQAYLQEGLDKYGGDPVKAAMYYHGGPDESLWGPKTRAYGAAVGAVPPQPAPQDMPTPQAPQAPQAPSQPQAMQPPQASPQQSWGPTPDEIGLLQQWAANPETMDRAEAYSFELQKKYAVPPKVETTTINGVPFFYNPNSQNPQLQSFGGVPQAAMNQTVRGGQLGYPGDPNAVYSLDPFGKPTSVAQAPAGYQFAQGGGMAPVRGGPQDPTAGQNLIQGEATLRGEYQKGQQEYQAARSGYEKVRAAAADGTGVSDLALIFGFMKTLDPNSTVREGEFATAQNSGSIDQSVMNLYNRVISGDRLQPEQRQQFLKTAETQYKTYEDRAKAANERFEGLARSYGYDPTRIVAPISPFAPMQTQQGTPQASTPPPAAGSKAAIEAEMRRRGLIK